MLLTSRSCIYSQVLVHSTVVNSRNGLRYICISAFLTHSDKFSHLSGLMPHSDPCPRNTHSCTGKPDSKVLNLFESVHNYGSVWRTDTSGLLFSVRFLFCTFSLQSCAELIEFLRCCCFRKMPVLHHTFTFRSSIVTKDGLVFTIPAIVFLI